jgi:hypothetical protein
MSEFKSKAEDLGQSVKDYAETYYKLTVLKASDKVTGIAAGGLAAVSIVFLGIFVLFFLGIAMGVWLGNVLNNAVAGYLLVAAFFLLLIIILVVLRKRIVFPMIRDTLIRKLYE